MQRFLPIIIDGEVSASYADGGVMSITTAAHDPSGPAGHLPSFSGEEG